MGIGQSLKIGRGESNYFTRVIELPKQTIESSQYLPILESAQKKLDKLDKEIDTQDWNKFVREIKIIFSNKSKVANIEWKIEMFKQGKKHIANFMTKFKVLVIKADINKLYMIFLLKKNI